MQLGLWRCLQSSSPGCRHASRSGAEDFHGPLQKAFELPRFNPRGVTSLVGLCSRESSDSIHCRFDNFVHSHGNSFSGDYGLLRYGDARPEFVSSRMTAPTVLLFRLVSGGSQLRLRSGVELERCPVEGLLKDGIVVGGMEEAKFRVAEGSGGVLALAQLAV